MLNHQIWINNFHTIKSILNLIGISDCNFHTIKSILNLRTHTNLRISTKNFHTIKSILNTKVTYFCY